MIFLSKKKLLKYLTCVSYAWLFMILFKGIVCRKYLDSFSFLMWKMEDDTTELSC